MASKYPIVLSYFLKQHFIVLLYFLHIWENTELNFILNYKAKNYVLKEALHWSQTKIMSIFPIILYPNSLYFYNIYIWWITESDN